MRPTQTTARNLNFLHSSTLTNSPRFEITTCWTDTAKPRNFVTQSRVYGWLARRGGDIQLQTTSRLLCEHRPLLTAHTCRLRHSLTLTPGPDCASALVFLVRSLSVVRHNTPRFQDWRSHWNYLQLLFTVAFWLSCDKFFHVFFPSLLSLLERSNLKFAILLLNVVEVA